MSSLHLATQKFLTLLDLLFFLLIGITLCPLAASDGCHEGERKALLNFKSSLEDLSGRLSSWQESGQHQNCCNWHGIQCSKGSFHVISIDLRNNDLEIYNNEYVYLQPQPNTALRGKLSPSLLNITHLEHLDLGFNDFQESKLTLQFSYLRRLVYLDISHSNFSGSISTQFTNSSSLQYLDLSCGSQNNPYPTSCLESSSTGWIRGLVNLQVLRLSGIKLPYTEPLLSTLYNLTSLSILDLSSCALHGSIPYLPQLKELDVSDNKDLRPDLTGMFKHSWPQLQKLQISSTNSTGSIPSSISNLSQLVSLSASWCSLNGFLPTSIYNLSRLQHLDLSGNNITSFIHSSISNLKDLYFLDLSFNKFQGRIPESICDIFPLTHLGLQYNNISGTIPSCITKLKNLSVFDVFGNSIRGEVSLISLINELNLTTLDLSSNNLTVVIDQHLNLNPSKSSLENLLLGSCNINGLIPTFICIFTNLKWLSLFRNNLRGAIPSCISNLKNLGFLDLSNNKLVGPLPLPPQGVQFFDISNNKLNGEISLETGERLSNVGYINLSGNELSGSIPSSICSKELGKHNDPGLIILSNNKLSGTIPASIGYCRNLTILNLSNNNLTGNVPHEIQNAEGLEYLYLSDNNLNGTIPESLLKLLSLVVLDLGNNNFDGNIRTSLGSMSDLMVLSLRSNKFSGSIPEEIFHLYELQILDLSTNNLSGLIPGKIGNLMRLTGSPSSGMYNMMGMGFQLVIKGTMTRFDHLYNYSSGIDLSCNSLDGDIPREIGFLNGLVMLNLSHNLLSNNIPSSVGNMSRLESLDLSSNRLSGHIPQALTSIDSLGFLNLSYNELSGIIPRGNHFDTLSLDGSSFTGNDLLCGFPTTKVCTDLDVSTGSTHPSNKSEEGDQEGATDELFYATVALGFGIGFLGLFLVLRLKKQKWWFPYWRFVDSVAARVVGCIHRN